MKVHILNKYFTVIGNDTQVILECQIIPDFIVRNAEISKVLSKLGIEEKSLCFQVSATAYLKSPDTFDKETGRRVAESKAMCKVFKKLTSLAIELIPIMNSIAKMYTKYSNAYKDEQEHLYKLSYDSPANS